jgi:hypothetical protein
LLHVHPERLAGLLTLVLPAGVRVGQTFRMNVQQYSGVTLPPRARRMLGAFQLNIPVKTDPDILPAATRNLAILRYVRQTIPATSRWNPIFERWLNGLAAKVAGLGGDPTKVLPSPTGGDKPAPPCPKPGRVRLLKLLLILLLLLLLLAVVVLALAGISLSVLGWALLIGAIVLDVVALLIVFNF